MRRTCPKAEGGRRKAETPPAAATRRLPLRPSTLRLRRAFTLVELLVVVAVIGLLIALLLPAVQAAREAARRAACENHLRQVGVALAAYAEPRDALPIGCVDCAYPPPNWPRKQTSWVTWTLPYLEEQALADRYDTTLPYRHADNRGVVTTILPVLVCPSAEGDRVSRYGAYTDYAGLSGVEGTPPQQDGDEADGGTREIPPEWFGVLVYERAVPLAEITDGLSRTLAVGEMNLRRVAGECEWASGGQLFSQERATGINPAPGDGLANELGSAHPDGALAVRCDGGVVFLADAIDQAVLNAWLTRAGGER